MAKQNKLPVSKRALDQRIRRALGDGGRRLVKSDGEWLIVSGDAIVSSHSSLSALAKLMGLVKPYEYVVD